MPAELKSAATTQVYAGENTADFARAVQRWRTGPGSIANTAPTAREPPPPADLAIHVPRPDLAPVEVLAQHACTAIPYAVLMPVDLVSQSYNPTLFASPPSPCDEIRTAVLAAGKLTFFDTQMIWIVGNIPAFTYSEMFAARLCAPAPILEMFPAEILADVPASLEDWIAAQNDDTDFAELVDALPDAAVRGQLHLYAPDDREPRILVPTTVREPLVRTTHVAMYHLGSAKVHSALAQSYYWPNMAAGCRRWLTDCPGCELEKARRNEAHALFSAAPTMAPRARWCMDFHCQGRALTGETEA
jgi:hypothetical protein